MGQGVFYILLTLDFHSSRKDTKKNFIMIHVRTWAYVYSCFSVLLPRLLLQRSSPFFCPVLLLPSNPNPGATARREHSVFRYMIFSSVASKPKATDLVSDCTIERTVDNNE